MGNAHQIVIYDVCKVVGGVCHTISVCRGCGLADCVASGTDDERHFVDRSRVAVVYDLVCLVAVLLAASCKRLQVCLVKDQHRRVGHIFVAAVSVDDLVKGVFGDLCDGNIGVAVDDVFGRVCGVVENAEKV